MSTNPSLTRVRSGLPWWVSGILILSTLAVLAGIMLSVAPEDPAEHYQNARKELAAGNEAEFQKSLAVLKRYPEYADKITFLDALKAAKSTRDPLALELFEKVKQNEELRAEVLQEMGQSLTRVGRFEDAIAAYEEGIALNKESSGATRVLLSRMYQGIGAIGLAEKVLSDAIEQDPNNKQALEERAAVRTGLDRFEAAFEDFDRILTTPGERAASNPNTLQKYAICLLKTNNIAAVEQLLSEQAGAITEKPLLGQLYTLVGNFEEARKQLDEAPPDPETNKPGELPPSKLLFILQLHDKDLEKAEQTFRKLLAMFPRDIELFELATELYTALNKPELAAIARQNAQQLQDLQKEMATTLVNVGGSIKDITGRIAAGKLMFQLGRYNDAQIWLNMAAALDKDKTHLEDLQKDIQTLYQRQMPLVPFPEDPAATPPSEEQPASTENSKPPAETDSAEKAKMTSGQKQDQASEPKPDTEDPTPAKNETKAESSDAAPSKSSDSEKPAEEKPANKQSAAPVTKDETATKDAEPAPAKEEPAKEEPAKEEPAKEEPVKEEPAKEEPAKEDPAKEDPAKEDPAKE